MYPAGWYNLFLLVIPSRKWWHFWFLSSDSSVPGLVSHCCFTLSARLLPFNKVMIWFRISCIVYDCWLPQVQRQYSIYLGSEQCGHIVFGLRVSLLSMYILVSLSDLTSNVILSFSAYRNLCPSIANLFVVLNKKNSSLTIYLVHLCI